MVPARTRGLPDCRPLLADPDDLTVVFRPVVRLADGTVAGYESQARFPGTAGPDVWFAAAADAGLAAEVEALLVHKALGRLPSLPQSTFLLVPVRASLLDSPLVQEALGTVARLDGLVVEVGTTGGHDAVPDAVAGLRARGAAVALPAAARPRRPDQVPDLVVLDRRTTGTLEGTREPVPGAPGLLADGVDSADDLTAALGCGADLARGWLIGPPSRRPEPLSPPVTELVRTRRARLRLAEAVLPLVRPVPVVAETAPGPAPAVAVDAEGSAVALLLAAGSGSTWRKPVTLRALPTAAVGETLRCALRRPSEHRYDPVLCTDETGRPLGLIRVADLVRAGRR
jgi:EAL domain-containing protein (putative c-di-GMP-specific phosphodiesterase class I)